jgi:hypothetical protein
VGEWISQIEKLESTHEMEKFDEYTPFFNHRKSE